MTRQAVYRTAARFLTLLPGLIACSSDLPDSAATDPLLPSILLITLDTTRADRLGFSSSQVETPAIDELARRGLRFDHAYATAPTTLPAHASIMTGLYPLQHGVHENGRRIDERDVLLAERLAAVGYRTAAFVSGYPLAARFGLARGFDHYDDDFIAGANERRAGDTADRVLAFLESHPDGPLFLWVHYFDPHEPYDPPEPFRSLYPEKPYLGEIAYADLHVGRLVDAFEARFSARPKRIVVVGDHGEGLGDHGETLHGNLLYQGVMRVPLVAVGDGIASDEIDVPVSSRHVFETVLHWAGATPQRGLLAPRPEPVLAEALKPFLQYGWQPQVMGVQGSVKVIRSGKVEIYDLASDPEEAHDLLDDLVPDRALLHSLGEYWQQSLSAAAANDDDLDQEARARLAALGYVGSVARPSLRDDAPNPKDMVHLFHDLDLGSALFVRRRYEEAIPVFARILEADPQNLMVCLRLAAAHSLLGHAAVADDLFRRARAISPTSVDVRHYTAMHLFRFDRWDDAAPLFESVLAEMPDRLPALEGMVQIRARQSRFDEASRYLERVIALKNEPGGELARLGEMRMAVGDTAAAIRAFERAHQLQGDRFAHSLELGVCYLADRQLASAAESLDRVPPSHSGYPMALFKRAQVSVLMGEPDRDERIRLAEEWADETTRALIRSEALFRDRAARP